MVEWNIVRAVKRYGKDFRNTHTLRKRKGSCSVCSIRTKK